VHAADELVPRQRFVEPRLGACCYNAHMSASPRRWRRLRLRTLLLLVLLSTVGWSAYTYWADYQDQAARRERELLSPARGAACTVVFRRELLGVDQMAPGPRTVNGVENYVSGRFIMMNDDWIVIAGSTDLDAGQRWVPREHVLMLELDGSP
jgi:hypothetical protein